MRKLMGFLTREDIELLEEASMRKLKYPKSIVKKFSCDNCKSVYFYKAIKCPACGGNIKEK